MRYSIVTFGCRVNQAESLAMEAELRARGVEPAMDGDADVVIVNSCSVTATADQGTRQAIRKIAREHPSARIVVTGCYATRRPDDITHLPGVVRIVPNAGKDALVDGLAESLEPMTTADRYAGGTGACGAPDVGHPRGRGSAREAPAESAGGVPVLRPGLAGRTAFTLRVQTGCEERCAYCIIPSTRGISRSTPPEALVGEVRRIEDAGYREVTLTGVHLGAYGRDLPSPVPLVDLVARLLDVTRQLVLRLGSLEPMDCPPALVELAAATDRLAPAFHLPLQHASGRVLRAMRRPYTCRRYADLVDAIRARLPHASLTADVIVGFPGETQEDADELASYLEASPLTQLHVFPYSDRPGTEAAGMPGKVPGAAIRERGGRMRAIGHELAATFRTSQAGRICRALTIEDGSAATADNGLRIEVGEGHRRNEHLRLRLALREGRLVGEPVATLTPASRA